MKPRRILFILIALTGSILFSNCATSMQTESLRINPDTVKSSMLDMGKMWTFDNPPVGYFEKEYDFKPTKEWLDKARTSALRFGGGCTASFVSEDGLIMTNHHCGRGDMLRVQKENEDLFRDGFVANTPEEERLVPDLFVEQLMLIEDVTDEINAAIEKGTDDVQKVELKKLKMTELEKSFSQKTGLQCVITPLYNGGKYSLYGYKRYNNIKLVMAPEFNIASTGWDYDNFTYPRYELDFMFFRAYDDSGRPAKTKDYFKFNTEGAEEGELIFVVGNPGRTGRLQTMAQLEYKRDYQYPMLAGLLKNIYSVYFELFNKYPQRESELLNMLMSVGNSKKVYEGTLIELNNDYLIAKKKDFEKTFRQKVNENPKLTSKYGEIWDEISDSRNEMKKIVHELEAYNVSSFRSSIYFILASRIIKLAEQMKLPESQRETRFKGNIDSLANILFPNKFDTELNTKLLAVYLKHIRLNLGSDNNLVKELTGGRNDNDAVEYILGKSRLTSKDKLTAFVKEGPDAILTSDDPFIKYVLNTRDKLTELQNKANELNSGEQLNNQLLGEALFDVFGQSMPPDATFTLRISDGVIKGYEYNGTLAPAKTTYYGMYDRYFSFNGKYPWTLPKRWQKPDQELNLEYPLNFASTNDIIGGNSGSAAINKNLEVIGLVFDGNMESHAGDFIFDPANNRTVAIDSKGLLEAISDVYKAKRLKGELMKGKIE